MEFYGPGVVELSRLTTGKATKEIEEIQAFLIAHGYESHEVQQFFAPLAHGVDVVDHAQHEREFFAYINANGHLINEGIVASLQLAQELSTELTAEASTIYRLPTRWATFIGFAGGIEGYDYIGLRLLGNVSLKGLANVEIAEIVPFAGGTVDAVPVGETESFITLLRQEYHERPHPEMNPALAEARTSERPVGEETVICVMGDPIAEGATIVIGQWDPTTDEIRQSFVIPTPYLRNLGLRMPLTAEAIAEQKDALQGLYRRMVEQESAAAEDSAPLRRSDGSVAFVLGEVVERL